MSRYSFKDVDNKGNELEINYGFDHVIGYWYDVWDHSKGDEDYECIIEEKSSAMSKMGNGEFLKFLIKHNLPKEHQKLVGLDLPF
tara:strand:- start:632 stop:886 length:255 start_codon:yes stop_codon:yes gene_type:complete